MRRAEAFRCDPQSHTFPSASARGASATASRGRATPTGPPREASDTTSCGFGVDGWLAKLRPGCEQPPVQRRSWDER